MSNEFFSFYYVLTGVHMFHVALGLLILGVAFANCELAQAPQDIAGRTGRHLLAHGRSALDRHLRPALRDEVTR